MGRVTKESLDVLDYQNLDFIVWENKINRRDFTLPVDGKLGDFEVFCNNLTFNNNERLVAFKTMIGFLLHKNKEIGDPKAVILYDEKMGMKNKHTGGLEDFNHQSFRNVQRIRLY